MKNTVLILVICFLTSTILSCSEEVTGKGSYKRPKSNMFSVTNTIYEEDLDDFLETEVEGIIMVHNQDIFNVTETGWVDMVAQFYHSEHMGNWPTPVTIASTTKTFTLDSSSAFGYNEDTASGALYGEDVIVTVGSLVTDTLYFPEQMHVQFTGNTIDTGTIFTWNADINNSKGIILFGDMSAAQQDSALGISTSVSVSMWTEDNGTMSIPTSFISQFPSGAHISITFMRGNYKILTDSNGDKYQFYFYTICGQQGFWID